MPGIKVPYVTVYALCMLILNNSCETRLLLIELLLPQKHPLISKTADAMPKL